MLRDSNFDFWLRLELVYSEVDFREARDLNKQLIFDFPFYLHLLQL